MGIPFWAEDQISDVERLLSADDDIDPLNYYGDGTRAVTSSSSVAMYTIAAEGLAGQIRRTLKCDNPDCGKERTVGVTDRQKLETILGREAYRKLYSNHGYLRNKLNAWTRIDEDE